MQKLIKYHLKISFINIKLLPDYLYSKLITYYAQTYTMVRQAASVFWIEIAIHILYFKMQSK